MLAPVVPLAAQATLAPDETPARTGEWGFHPPADTPVSRNPPPFVWRPQDRASSYDWQAAPDDAFTAARVERVGLPYAAYRPSAPFAAGTWWWRFRFHASDGRVSAWSTARSFTVTAAAKVVGMPPFEELRARLPDGHPRLFVRPEDRAHLRELADGALAEPFARLRERCDALVAKPPDTGEPPRYPEGTVRGSEDWRAIWWGNRKRTIAVLEPAAQLAFEHWLTGDERYAAASKRLLLAAAAWDPHGATGYRYNDEAGMPFAYWFARTYTFLHDALDDQERARCCDVMRVRGGEMYAHLAPGHLWRPFNSHANRAWHFLGELGVAFDGEIDAADDWLRFATTVFGTVYPVWSDSDGGWHEGLAYWRSYLERFTWWADVMRTAISVDAYAEPFFSRVGDFAMYVQPPGSRGGGFGDLTARLRSKDHARLMALFARQAGNPYWEWYADQHGTRTPAADFIEILRLARPAVTAKAPSDLPSSTCFRGTGVAVLQTDLLDGKDDVQVMLKSSPFGSQSHGYEAQNSLLLNAYGERLLIRSGRRDVYGSPHHRNWMWSTRSTNCVTVSGKGQRKHSAAAVGRIAEFATGGGFHYAVGEAGAAYAGGVGSFRRAVLLVEPDVIVVFDALQTDAPETPTWWWHAEQPFQGGSDRAFELAVGNARCGLYLLWPRDLEVEQTDRFDPPPVPRVHLVEHHLTATPREAKRPSFGVTVMLPRRASDPARSAPVLEQVDGGFAVHVQRTGGDTLVLLRTDGDAVRSGGFISEATVAAVRVAADGTELARFASGDGTLRVVR